MKRDGSFHYTNGHTDRYAGLSRVQQAFEWLSGAMQGLVGPSEAYHGLAGQAGLSGPNETKRDKVGAKRGLAGLSGA